MLHYRRYGFVLPQTDSFAAALAAVFQLIDVSVLGTVPVRFPGGKSCSQILERVPELAPFAVCTPQPDRSFAIRLSNLDGRWQGGNREADGEPSRATLLSVAEGIPAEFPLWIAVVMSGPLRWNEVSVADLIPREASAGRASLNKPPFSGQAPSMTYLTPGVILQRLSAGGLRLWLTVQFPEPTDSPNLAVVQRFIARFGPFQTDVPMTVSEEQEIRVAPPEAPDPAKIHAVYKGRMAEIVGGLSLPFHPPDVTQFAQFVHEPLGKIRPVIVDTFKKNGWKRSPERLPAGSHKLVKQTPGGRRLELSFDTGSWSRHAVCIMALISERGSARLIIPADLSSGLQYMTPNPQVFAGVLENMRIVVAHLESTWLPEMESALGPLNN
jgi:hypothetical protein